MPKKTFVPDVSQRIWSAMVNVRERFLPDLDGKKFHSRNIIALTVNYTFEMKQ